MTGWYDLNRGMISAPLKDWSQRDISEGEIARAINRKLNSIPGARARVRRRNSLGLRSAGGGIRFALTGADYTEIAEAADRFVVAMEKDVPQVQNLRIEFRATQPQLAVRIDRARATDLGVSITELAATMKALVDTDEVAHLTVNDDRIPIVVQASAGAVTDPSDLANLFVNSSSGRLVPLSQLISFKETAVAAELDRHGQRRAVEIFGDPVEGYSLREAVKAVQAAADRALPSGIGLLFLDEAAALNETSHGVAITYLVALFIVFLVLVAQFESVTSALVVLLTVPFGVCAAVFALALTGTSINIYSQIGVLMLIGIMAKNAILMVEFADQLREKGESVRAAAREASLVRLRPIAMTMVSTVLAGLPLILGSGAGIEARAAIGWVVFGGLALAAVFTLFLTPTLYVLIAGLVSPRNVEATRVEAELDEAGADVGQGGRVDRTGREGTRFVPSAGGCGDKAFEFPPVCRAGAGLADQCVVAQPIEVDVELVFLSDASNSIDNAEIKFQRSGYASAITHRDVLDAISPRVTSAELPSRSLNGATITLRTSSCPGPSLMTSPAPRNSRRTCSPLRARPTAPMPSARRSPPRRTRSTRTTSTVIAG